MGSSKAQKRGLFLGLLNKSWEFGGLATKFVDDPKIFAFAFMQFLDQTQPGGAMGWSKAPKGVRFLVCSIKVGNPGVLHKTKLEDDQETLTFGFMQRFD